MSKRILVSWIGHDDLRAMAKDLPDAEKKAVFSAVRELPPGDPHGRFKTLLQSETFDEIHLLSNYEMKLSRQFQSWLGRKSELHVVKLEEVYNYGAVFEFANERLAEIASAQGNDPFELCLYLTPGTSAMAAVWVLLGKTRFPATFYQTDHAKCWKTAIPFSLAIDFWPEYLDRFGRRFQHLSEHGPGELPGFENIVGESPLIREAVGRANRVAKLPVSVLILGESGTGKEMFAQAIHKASNRAEKPFVAVNCAAISPSLFESEFFGHEKGAFTGADRDHAGLLQQADGGTLFLDEIGEMPLEFQAKLLRVLQPDFNDPPGTMTFRRVGGKKPIVANVRLLAATNRDLLTEIAAGKFRSDLFYRFAEFSIQLPPLRERGSDIPLLAEGCLAKINHALGFAPDSPRKLSPRALDFIKTFNWPGNVRQLENALRQAAILSNGQVIERSDIEAAVPRALQPHEIIDTIGHPWGDGFCLKERLAEIEMSYLKKAMEEAGGVQKKAAELLGIQNYQTLAAKLDRFGLR